MRWHRLHFFTYSVILVALGDGDEVVCLEGCAADKAAVDVLLGEEFLGVGRLAASAVEDCGVLGYCLTELLGEDLADAGVDFLGLLSGSGLACADGPYRLVSHNDLGYFLSGEVVEDVLGLLGNDLEVLSGLSLLKVLTYAEDHAETCGESELGLLDELLIGLTIVLPSLGVSEDGPLAAYGSKHIH